MRDGCNMPTDTNQFIINTSELKKYYYTSDSFINRVLGSDNRIKAVDGVNLKIKKGKTYGLVGESGSGKSTLGETVLQLQEPTAGTISFKGNKLKSFEKKDIKSFRKEAQIILQDPYEALNPKQTVYQIVSEPLRNYFDYPKPELEKQVANVLTDVGLRPAKEFFDLYPNQMSGGQRQRINIARAIILKPDFLVADEPLSMLDVSVQGGLLKLLDRLKQEYEFSMLYISHNLTVVKMISDHIGVMYKGRIVEEGETNKIMENPKHPYSKALIDSIPKLDGERERVTLPEDKNDDSKEITGCRFHPRCPKKMDVCEAKKPALEYAEQREVACYLYHTENIN